MTRGRLLLLAVLQRTGGANVAARCGVTKQAVSAWATGIKKPSVAARRKLESAYRIPWRAWDAVHQLARSKQR